MFAVNFAKPYLQNIRQRRIFPNVTPGCMRTLVPETAPQDGESWEDIFGSVERVIMPGVSICALYFPFKCLQ
jgi:histidine decarboxylase